MVCQKGHMVGKNGLNAVDAMTTGTIYHSHCENLHFPNVKKTFHTKRNQVLGLICGSDKQDN